MPSARLPLLLSISTLVACSGLEAKGVEDDNTWGCRSDNGERLSCSQIELRVNKDVDILFVIDNSASMGEEQAKLTASVDSLIGALEGPALGANYRIAFTTTDNGNPWCTDTTPEAGELVYASCTDRSAQFISQAGDVDMQSIACSDACNLSSAELGIDADSPPWLETVEGTSNLPAGISPAQAFRCLAPQGIDGCGFESPLESMNKALIRSGTPDQAAFGFVRDNALLTIVHLTDEIDCSYNNAWVSIFEQDGNKAFWWDTSDQFPTSAVCWNAGVACTGDPTNYECTAQDYAVDGSLIESGSPTAEDSAVLHPLSRYVERVEGIENQKKEISPGREVIVALIGGVAGDGQPLYAETADADYMRDFGIGPGCSATVAGATTCMSDADCVGIGEESCSTTNRCLEAQSAAPPVRLAQFTQSFTDQSMFTVCSDDYAPALGAIAEAIADQLGPACFPECVADQNTDTPDLLEADCVVTQRVGAMDFDIPECARAESGTYLFDGTAGGFQMPADTVDACYALVADASGTQTTDPNDDMSAECLAEGYNLEFKLARRPGVPAPAGSIVNATCDLSEDPQIDCPGL